MIACVGTRALRMHDDRFRHPDAIAGLIIIAFLVEELSYRGAITVDDAGEKQERAV